MTHDFDMAYWQSHWEGHGHTDRSDLSAHPYVAEQLGELAPGTALDAGCGAGAEALWLAERGWTVTAVDSSWQALAAASERASRSEGGELMTFVEADLSTWEPDTDFDLVTTYYAHPTTSHWEFYQRIARWVAPGGTLLIIGHLHTGHADPEPGHPPREATVTAQSVVAAFDPKEWEIVTAAERRRPVQGHPAGVSELHDVVVRLVHQP